MVLPKTSWTSKLTTVVQLISVLLTNSTHITVGADDTGYDVTSTVQLLRPLHAVG